MRLNEPKVSDEILELDPREYVAKPAAIEASRFEILRGEIFPRFQEIGAKLARIKALPLQEEPPGSGNFVTSGNFSILAEEGGFFITGSGVNKERPKPQDILYVERINYESGEIFLAGGAKHSRETLIHDLIYRSFPDARAVIHSHDKVALLYDRSPTTVEQIFFANAREAEEVIELLKKSSYVHLRNHGQFLRADSVTEAIRASVQHHRNAVRRLIFNRIREVAPPLAFAGGLALAVGTVSYKWHQKFGDCQLQNNNNGTQSYLCPTIRDCGPLKSWEGEKEGFRIDDQYECKYSTISPTS